MSATHELEAARKYITVNRNQLKWETLDLEQLIGANHAARLIWEVSGTLDLSGFEKHNKSVEGRAGRPSWPPRLLFSVWVYAYSIGVSSARGIERMMTYEPALRWLTGDQVINYHSLADFRVGHEGALEELFAQFLVLLDDEGMVDLATILQDGTKVKAVAGRRSYHRRKTLDKKLRRARRVLRELDQRAEQEAEGVDRRRAAAQLRAARESVERMQAALQQMKQMEEQAPASRQSELRVSVSEPEARNMKQPDGGFGLSYNVQVSTEARSRMIVAVGVTAAPNDTHELIPALVRVAENCGELPERVIADNGYATRDNVEQTAELGVELIAPWKDGDSRAAGACKANGIDPEFGPAAFRAQRGGTTLVCPAGQTLVVIQQKTHHGLVRNVFSARQQDCAACSWRSRCCGKRAAPRRVERVVESAPMRQYLRRMKQRGIRELYRSRCEVAEFPHLWSKAVKGWRRFSVRGLMKAGMEALWVAFAYNVAQWLSARPAIRLAA